MQNIKTLAAVSVAGLIPVAGNAATVTIDSFLTTQIVAAPTGGGASDTATVSASEAIGGVRTITAAGDGVITPGNNTTVFVNAGTASVSNSDSVTGTGLFEWNAGGFDLTDGGTNDTFVLQIASVDLNVSFTLEVDGLSQTSAFNSTTGAVSFGFGAFGDLTSANDISLFVEGPASFDARFSFLGAEDLEPNMTPSAVPLPAGGFLLGSILFGGGIAARRKAKKG